MYLEKQSEVLRQIGPFEQAQTNLDKFVWNFMILYTTHTVSEAYKKITDCDSAEAKITEMTAEITIRGVFQLVLDKDNGVWD